MRDQQKLKVFEIKSTSQHETLELNHNFLYNLIFLSLACISPPWVIIFSFLVFIYLLGARGIQIEVSHAQKFK